MAAGDGLVTMTPTSIAHSGTSATITADGGVDFTTITSLSLNGVFTSSFNNYLIVVSGNGSGDNQFFYGRLRLSGTDASGSNYARQRLFASGVSAGASRLTSQDKVTLGCYDSEQRDLTHIHVYGPALALPTAFRSTGMHGHSGAVLGDTVGTHSLSTAYDGITILPESPDTMTGNIVVLGYEE